MDYGAPDAIASANALNQIAAGVAETDSVSSLFDCMCDSLDEIANGACYGVWMLDEEKECVVCCHRRAPDDSHAAFKPFYGKNSNDGLFLLLSEFKDEKGWVPYAHSDCPRCEGSRGLAYLRLQTHDGINLLFTACVPNDVGGNWNGFLPFFSALGQQFTAQLKLLRLQRERCIASRIADLSVSKRMPEDFFEEVARVVGSEFQAAGCSVFLYDQYQDSLVFGGTTSGLFDRVTGHEFDADQLSRLTYKRSRGMTGWIFSEKKIVRLYDADNEDEIKAFNANLAQMNTNSKDRVLQPRRISSEKPNRSPRPFLGVPILFNDQCLGVIRLHGRTNPDFFLKSDENLMNAVSKEIGRSFFQWMALGKSRGFERREQDFMKTVRHRVCNDPYVKQNLELVAKQTRVLFNGVAASILLVGEMGQTLEVVADCSERPTSEKVISLPVSEGLCGRAFRERCAVLAPDAQNHQDFCRLDDVSSKFLDDVLSEACCPIYYEDHVLGVLNVDSSTLGVFEDDAESEKARILERMASYAARVMMSRRNPEVADMSALETQSIIHEFQNDLGSLSGLANAVADESLSQHRRNQHAKEIERVQQQRAKYWNTISDLTALEDRSPQSLRVATIWKILQDLHSGTDAAKRIMFAPVPPEVAQKQIFVDLIHLNIVFANLISNAVRYSPAGSEILFCCGVSRDSISFSVSNEGKKIPSDRLDRLGKEVTLEGGGNGVGLVLANQLIEMNGGKLSASSDHQTTTFSIELPILPPHQETSK